MACTLDLAAARRGTARRAAARRGLQPRRVAGRRRLACNTCRPALLDALGIPYTGAPTEAIFQTTHKLLAKQLLHLAGLPTPAWIVGEGRRGDQPAPADGCAGGNEANRLAGAAHAAGRPMHHQGRLGTCLARAGRRGTSSPAESGRASRERLRDAGRQSGRPCFAEQFIEGREFNLSLLGGARRAGSAALGRDRLLRLPARKTAHRGPSGEMGAGLVRVPPYAAAVRFPARGSRRCWPGCSDLARACWGLFGLRGYARVDFRVDRPAGRGSWRSTPIRASRPTPVLSPPPAGAASDFDQMIQRILDQAFLPEAS